MSKIIKINEFGQSKYHVKIFIFHINKQYFKIENDNCFNLENFDII